MAALVCPVNVAAWHRRLWMNKTWFDQVITEHLTLSELPRPLVGTDLRDPSGEEEPSIEANAVQLLL